MRLGWLYADMALTLFLIIALTTLALSALLYSLGPAVAAASALGLNLVMWLASPWVIEAIYRLRELKPSEAPALHEALERISRRSGVRKPRLMLAPVSVPNAFAYGTLLSGYRVAVTEGLLEILDLEELEAVLAHEVGHIAHRDVEVMMLASALPAVLYHAGRAALWSSGRREGELKAAGAAALALAALLWLVSLRLSRLREYYADAHSAVSSGGGPAALQRALAKIALASDPSAAGDVSAARPLFIHDPSVAVSAPSPEALIEALRRRGPSALERVAGLFSTHPSLADRVRALDRLAEKLGRVGA